MRGISVFGYSIKQGLVSLKKNRMFTLASVGTVAACLFLFGLFYFVLSNFQYMIHTAENSVGVTVFFDAGISEEGIQTIGEIIQNRPEVERMEFISAEEAWERFKAENFQDSPELVESFQDDNPLADSASYEVYLKETSMQRALVEYLETVDGVREVKRSDEVAVTFSSVNKLVGGGSAALILVLLLVSVFLIHSTIATGIAVRKPEIAIMRLMGASDYFIWAPFIVEGIIIGIIGAAVPLLMLIALYGRIVAYLSERFSIFAGSLTFLDTGSVFAVLVPVSLAVGVGIGFLGSFITVRRNLNI
ncbi:MAG: ABC transporter permease [Lachnospiraceae bacterium]|nr:ABC transporter permease [Lachnospiraceae bacterium]